MKLRVFSIQSTPKVNVMISIHSLKWMTVFGAALLALSMLTAGCLPSRSGGGGSDGDGGFLIHDTGSDGGFSNRDAGSDTQPPNEDDVGDTDITINDAAETNDTGDTSDAADSSTCPTARLASDAGASMIVAPGASVELDASLSTAVDGSIESYQWSVIDFPHASDLPHLEPELMTRANGTATFVANAVGSYVVDLGVVDSAGNESCNTARAEVTVAADTDIFVELVWDTPGDNDQTDDDGTDMDLHYRHPDGDWGLEPLDIFWHNLTADWGDDGDRQNDPEMILVAEEGGPESIEHNSPQALRYAVGIYYYDDFGYGASEATVRIYLDGMLAHEVSAVSLAGADTFYEAVTIDADTSTVAIDDVHYDGYPPIN
jgi:hypothetical protein